MSAANTDGVMGFLRRVVTENVGLKLIALVASLVLFVMRGTADDTGIVSPRLVAPEREGFVLISDPPDQVHVSISGSRSLVNAVRAESHEAIRIPEDFEERFFYIEASQIELPPGVTVDSIEPTAIELIWAEQGENRFDIDPVVEGSVAEGFIRVRTSVEPATVVISGAAPALEEISRVRTQRVDVAGLTEGEHELRVPLMPLADHLGYIGTQSVIVTVVVEAEEGHRTLEDVEVATVGGVELELRPAHVGVTLRGPRGRVEDLHPRRVIPFVDASGFDPELGAQPMPVQFRPLPDDISVTAEPSEVLVMPRGER